MAVPSPGAVLQRSPIILLNGKIQAYGTFKQKEPWSSMYILSALATQSAYPSCCCGYEWLVHTTLKRYKIYADSILLNGALHGTTITTTALLQHATQNQRSGSPGKVLVQTSLDGIRHLCQKTHLAREMERGQSSMVKTCQDICHRWWATSSALASPFFELASWCKLLADLDPCHPQKPHSPEAESQRAASFGKPPPSRKW